jgi:DNA-binding Lrp family transcriptional regulator
VPRATARRGDELAELDRQVLDAVPVASPAPVLSVARTAGLSERTVREALPRLREGGFVEASARGWRLRGDPTS